MDDAIFISAREADAVVPSKGGDFMDLLESERFLLSARLMHAMAEADAGMQRARLDWALGRGAPEEP